jgi:hypothetical protein
MVKVYLVGQISIDYPITYQWRKEFRDYFYKSDIFSAQEGEYLPTKNGWIDIVDPCDTLFNKSVLAKNNGDDPNRLKAYKTKGIKILPSKDRGIVKWSDIGVANMNAYDPKKPLIGSFFELAWYYDSPEKTVIGIYDGDPQEAINSGHPFVQDTVNTWVKDHIEAAKLIEFFFKRGVN